MAGCLGRVATKRAHGTDRPDERRPDGGAGGDTVKPRTKASLLWGAIGAFVFLVLVQGYTLLVAATPTIGFLTKLAVAVGVGVLGAVSSYALEGWLVRSERS